MAAAYVMVNPEDHRDGLSRLTYEAHLSGNQDSPGTVETGR